MHNMYMYMYMHMYIYMYMHMRILYGDEGWCRLSCVCVCVCVCVCAYGAGGASGGRCAGWARGLHIFDAGA